VDNDWAGLLGLRLARTNIPDRYSRLVVSTPACPPRHPMPKIWVAVPQGDPDASRSTVGRFVQGAPVGPMSDLGELGLRSHRSRDNYCARPRAMPGLVPHHQRSGGAANDPPGQRCARVRTPMLVAFSDGDPIGRRHAWRALQRDNRRGEQTGLTTRSSATRALPGQEDAGEDSPRYIGPTSRRLGRQHDNSE